MSVDLIPEDDLRAALRPYRVDPDTFEAAVRRATEGRRRGACRRTAGAPFATAEKRRGISAAGGSGRLQGDASRGQAGPGWRSLQAAQLSRFSGDQLVRATRRDDFQCFENPEHPRPNWLGTQRPGGDLRSDPRVVAAAQVGRHGGICRNSDLDDGRSDLDFVSVLSRFRSGCCSLCSPRSPRSGWAIVR